MRWRRSWRNRSLRGKKADMGENMKFQKNDIVTVEIEDIGSEGEGIGKVDGFTLFVKDAVAGDKVEARIVMPTRGWRRWLCLLLFA